MPPPRFQFSLAALLLTVAAVAGVLALMLRPESALTSLGLVGLTLVCMAFVTIELVYGRESVRPFCIGAAFPLLLAFLYIGSTVGGLLDDIAVSLGHGRVLDVIDFTAPITVNHIIGTAILASIALGYLCVGFRWLVDRRQPPDA